MTISVDAQELALYIENSGELYERAMKPTQRNLATKKARGVYKHDLAVKAFVHVAKLGAKMYERENGDGTWRFTSKQIAEAAKELADGFEAEWKSGTYNELLPAKYKEKPATDGKLKKALLKKLGSSFQVIADQESDALTIARKLEKFAHDHGHKALDPNMDIAGTVQATPMDRRYEALEEEIEIVNSWNLVADHQVGWHPDESGTLVFASSKWFDEG